MKENKLFNYCEDQYFRTAQDIIDLHEIHNLQAKIKIAEQEKNEELVLLYKEQLLKKNILVSPNKELWLIFLWIIVIMLFLVFIYFCISEIDNIYKNDLPPS